MSIVEEKIIIPRVRRLRASWTLEVYDDLCCYYDENLNKQLSNEIEDKKNINQEESYLPDELFEL